MHKAANAVHKAREPVRSQEGKRSAEQAWRGVRAHRRCRRKLGLRVGSCGRSRGLVRVCAAAWTREGSWVLEVLMHGSSGEFGPPGMVSGTVAAARFEHLGGQR